MELAISAPATLDSRLPEVGTPTGVSDVVRTASAGVRESAHTPVSKVRTDILLQNLTQRQDALTPIGKNKSAL